MKGYYVSNLQATSNGAPEWAVEDKEFVIRQINRDADGTVTLGTDFGNIGKFPLDPEQTGIFGNELMGKLYWPPETDQNAITMTE